MSWFSRKKETVQEPLTEQRSAQDECICQSENLMFADLLGRDYSYRSLGPVYACVELISNAISSMPLTVVKVDEHNHREVVKHDPLQVIFKSKNIQTMTMPAIMKSVMTDVLLKGAGFILIERGAGGVVKSLRYLPYGSVAVQYNEYNNTLSYIVSMKMSENMTKKSTVKSKDIIHITRVTRDGVNGQSVMQFAKSSADLAKAAEISARNFFESGMNVTGILAAKTNINQNQVDQIKQRWQSGGASGKATIQVLPFGIDYQALGVSGKDAQLLESRAYNSLVISQFFGVPEQLINSAAKLTYNSLEQLNLLFYQHTLQPIIAGIEAEMSRKFFPGDSELYVDMDESEFLFRTDKQSEATYISTLVNGGIITVNEAREMLNMSEVPDGDTLHIAYSDASKAEIGNDNNV